jgi:hypothetical protein
MLEEAYGKGTKEKTQVYEWHERFRDGHETAAFFYTTTHLHIGRWWSKSTFPSTV